MSSTPPSGGRLFVEPLEARIAPAILLANNPAEKGQPGYIDYSTPAVPGQTSGFVSASSLGVAPNDPTVHALRLTTGDELLIFNQGTGFNPNSPSLQITAGNAIAFFKDKNNDGQVQGDELVGLALSKKSGATVMGSVDGDIVTNVGNDGSLMLNSAGKPGFALNQLNISGSVNGSIITGGNLGTNAAGSITITGTAHTLLAGTAANGVSFNFSGTPGEVSGTIVDAGFKDFKPGASIQGIAINGVTTGGLIKAGNGGFGAVGGNVTNLNVQGDTDAFTVLAGAGGSGNATIKGGAGGGISQVLIQGVANSEVNHPILIQGGLGGVNSAGKAGAGGTVTQIATSFGQNFDFAGNTGTLSPSLLAQDISVHGGNGGDGLRGGTGGAVFQSSLFGSIPAAGTGTPEIQAVGGDGGHDTGADGTGKGGLGGQVNGIIAENLDTLADANASTILLQGGNGLTGKNGGGVSNVTLLGRNLEVTGGNGGDGYNVAGSGGALLGINVTNLTNLFTSTLTLNGGQGGNAGAGNGGDGGSIGTVALSDADLTALSINMGTHGNGGSSQGSHGGNGGAVSGVTLTDTGATSFLTALAAAPVAVRSGAGGNGQTGGGAGGGITDFTMIGTGFSYALTAGAGGSVNVGGTGDGGAGGGLQSVGVSNFLDTTNLSLNVGLLSGAVTAGVGGAGTVNGGAGGGLNSVILNAGSSVNLIAGAGGIGGTSADGAGGSITASGANSLFGDVNLFAGTAGANGAAGGDGGAITGFTATAGGNISMIAGAGHAGGMGGKISMSGTTLNQFTGLPNEGSVIIRAGDGSSGNGVGGVGGDITGFQGYVGLLGSTTFTAGAGGGGEGQAKLGAGGSVTQIDLLGSGENFGGLVRVGFDAGNAGVSSTAKRGANGGTVDNITLSNLDDGTLVHHFAAGDGSNGINRGGTGGSVTNIHVGVPGDRVADIGQRFGEAFGYATDQSGGIFAGTGGNGAKSSGLNGDVKVVTAAAISGIVAGKASRVALVNTIDSITLEGNSGTELLANADGSFSNFDTANFVGSIYNNGNGPAAAGASAYKPGDGLVASLAAPTNVNFFPEAELISVNGQRTLIDVQQPNLTAVVTTPAPANLA